MTVRLTSHHRDQVVYFWVLKTRKGKSEREKGVGGGHTTFYCGWSNEPPEITVTFSPRPLTPRSRAQLHPRLQGMIKELLKDETNLLNWVDIWSHVHCIHSSHLSFPPFLPEHDLRPQSRMFFLWTSFGTRCLKCCDETIFIVICVSMSMYFIARENNGQSSLLTWFVFFPLLYHP